MKNKKDYNKFLPSIKDWGIQSSIDDGNMVRPPMVVKLRAVKSNKVLYIVSIHAAANKGASRKEAFLMKNQLARTIKIGNAKTTIKYLISIIILLFLFS